MGEIGQEAMIPFRRLVSNQAISSDNKSIHRERDGAVKLSVRRAEAASPRGVRHVLRHVLRHELCHVLRRCETVFTLGASRVASCCLWVS